MIKSWLCKLLGHKVDWSLEAFKAEIGFDAEKGGSWFRCKRCQSFYKSKCGEFYR